MLFASATSLFFLLTRFFFSQKTLSRNQQSPPFPSFTKWLARSPLRSSPCLVSLRPTAWLLHVSWSWSREEREREREKKGKETCEVDDGNRRWGELSLFVF